MPVPPFDSNQIVVTASRIPQAQAATPATVTVLDDALIEHLGEPLVPDTAAAGAIDFGQRLRASRLADRSPDPRRRGQPHPAVHRRHPRQRSRDGRPASFRPPQCRHRLADRSRARAAVGPVGIGRHRRGGGGERHRTGSAPAIRPRIEGGSFGFERGSGSARTGVKQGVPCGSLGVAARDRHRQLQRPRRQGRLSQPVGSASRDATSSRPQVTGGASLFALSGRSDFDGFDPVTFLHADTLDNSRNRMAAGRLWATSDRRRSRGAAASAARCSVPPTATISPTSSSTGPAARAGHLAGSWSIGSRQGRCSIRSSPQSRASGRPSMPATRSTAARRTRIATAPITH